MIRFKVTILSQPAALVVVYVAVVFDEVYMIPCQLNESQAVNTSVDVVVCVTVKLNIAVESQPAALVYIFVYEPLVL
jgi:hypothetical protein